MSCHCLHYQAKTGMHIVYITNYKNNNNKTAFFLVPCNIWLQEWVCHPIKLKNYWNLLSDWLAWLTPLHRKLH